MKARLLLDSKTVLTDGRLIQRKALNNYLEPSNETH